MSDGEVVGGRYRLVRPLGAGGFGQVWLAHDEELNVEVALKQVSIPHQASEAEREERNARAVREARHAARLRDHRNIVTVYDALRERGGAPWIVMQYVAGRSLAEELRKRGRLPVDEVERVAAGALAGLAAAHAAGIVHRDVKPANVLLSTDRRVMLTDFGIALAATDTALTAEGVVIGTPGYLAPELWRGTKPGAPADLFALGVTLYEAVEGEPPFPRHNPTAALTDPPLRPAHAGRLAPLLVDLLEKDPDRRPDADSALARLRALPDTVRGTAPGTPLDAASQATTKVLHPPRTRKSEPEQPPSSTGPLTITTSRVEAIKDRGNRHAKFCSAAMFVVIGLLMGGLTLGHVGAATELSVGDDLLIVLGATVAGWIYGWVQGGWRAFQAEPDSLTVGPAGLIVTGGTKATYKWSDLAAVRLKRSGATVTVSATVLPERAADQAFRRKHFGIDKEGKVDVYVGRGVPVSDYGSLIAALSRNAGDLYQGPTHLL
ncbi:serine/threonine-protein kinase [Streptomyces cuspidosporus]|uniref:non-specific serine/threonine protein kinase n=1 Tax=Streptomyces cuspidosporus TaxID=66882 RepID=A0ABN3FKA2_9ACTN